MTARLSAGFALSLLLAACSSGERSDVPEVELVGAPGCFNVRDVQDFRAIDRSRLIVFAPNDSRAFQLRISPPSSTLRGAPRIAFDSRSGQICGRAGERIYFDGPGRMSHAITNVRRLDRASAELLRGGNGVKGEGLEPETEAAADIEPLPGAGEAQADEQSKAGEP